MVSRFLVCIQKEKPSFRLASCLMIARTVPIYQITYEGIGNGRDLGLDLFEVLYTINRLNQELVAYYTLLVDSDGELFIRYVESNSIWDLYAVWITRDWLKIASEVRRTLLELKDENDS